MDFASFAEFALQCGAVDSGALSADDVDGIFRSANVTTVRDPRNPSKALTRFQFLEAVVRLAAACFAPGVCRCCRRVPLCRPFYVCGCQALGSEWGTLSDSCSPSALSRTPSGTTPASSTASTCGSETPTWSFARGGPTSKLCLTGAIIARCAGRGRSDGSGGAVVTALLTRVVVAVCRRYCVQVPATGEKKHITLDRFFSLVMDAGLMDAGMDETEVKLAFALSVTTVEDQLASDRCRQLTMPEFLDAIGRLAAMKRWSDLSERRGLTRPRPGFSGVTAASIETEAGHRCYEATHALLERKCSQLTCRVDGRTQTLAARLPYVHTACRRCHPAVLAPRRNPIAHSRTRVCGRAWWHQRALGAQLWAAAERARGQLPVV